MLVLDEYKMQLGSLNETLELAHKQMNADALSEELKTLEAQMGETDFWNDVENANKITARVKAIKSKIERLSKLDGQSEDIETLIEMAEEEGDESLVEELKSELKSFDEKMTALRLEMLLKGPYDNSNAILSLHAGAGGTEAQDWAEMLAERTMTKSVANAAAEIIGKRAAMELKPDDIVNIGVGIPETITKYARENGMLDKVTLTVESGGIGGFPASGKVFGAVIGADSIYDMANQFDLYNNGGLDICFMGGIEVDRFGNVNAHKGPGAFAGVGGFANITAKTSMVVFCLTFNTKGLAVEEYNGRALIKNEGAIDKFVDRVKSITFSAKRARENRQRVIYITERCVFELAEKGLKLVEVYPGVDAERDILSRLRFPVETALM